MQKKYRLKSSYKNLGNTPTTSKDNELNIIALENKQTKKQFS